MPRNFIKANSAEATKILGAKPVFEDNTLKSLDIVGADGAIYRIKAMNSYSETLIIYKAVPETRKLYAVVLKGENGEADTYFYDGPDTDKAYEVLGLWRKKLSVYDDSLAVREHDEPIPDED